MRLEPVTPPTGTDAPSAGRWRRPRRRGLRPARRRFGEPSSPRPTRRSGDARAPRSASGDAGRLTVFAMPAAPACGPGRPRARRPDGAGYVTLPDIAPTILGWKGIEVPDVGQRHRDHGRPRPTRPPRSRPGCRTGGSGAVPRPHHRAGECRVHRRAGARVRRRRPRGRPAPPTGARAAAAAVALAVLAFPTVTFLSGLVRYRRLPLAGYMSWPWSRRPLRAGGVADRLASSDRSPAAVGLVALGWSVQVIDIVTGGRLQLDTPFGYSPIVAGRFQGYGNLSFSIVAMSAIVVMTARLAAVAGQLEASRRAVLGAVPRCSRSVTARRRRAAAVRRRRRRSARLPPGGGGHHAASSPAAG